MSEQSYRVPFTDAATANLGYDRSQLQAGIVHIGPSHFARSHLLKMVHDLLPDDPRWGVKAISLRNHGIKKALEPQDYIFPLIERAEGVDKTNLVGSLIDVTVAMEDPQEAVDVLADPDIKLVTMTVTEAGYYYDKTTGNLDFSNEDIKKCLSNMDEPSTVVGLLVASLEKRMKTGAPPLTIMSCDNMDANGSVLRNVVLAYADKKDSRGLGKYIRDNITFPTTMVDRITPSTPEEFQNVADETVFNWPVVTTPMPEYALVIENNFAADMPDLVSVGATIVDDVTPYKNMKVRLLNGAHMALGCVGRVAGYDTVIDAINDPKIEKFVAGFIEEAKNTLVPLDTIDYDLYADDVLNRLKNPKITDRLWRLVRNGTEAKLDKRLLGSLSDSIANKTGHDHIAFATAAWMHHLAGVDNNGQDFDIQDPYAIDSGLQQLARAMGEDPSAIIGASNKFPAALQGNDVFKDAVQKHYKNIKRHGVLQAASLLNGLQGVPSPHAGPDSPDVING
ncbi:MAG: hypothetical protein CMH27_02985 [Micavibrio sp.]|nr:hypothetical protein [Micavibrio sp.]|tara:strand:- start:2677 stop:4197 length:1521 start_codon:yes stop_codon:yes gene_type:complete